MDTKRKAAQNTKAADISLAGREGSEVFVQDLEKAWIPGVLTSVDASGTCTVKTKDGQNKTVQSNEVSMANSPTDENGVDNMMNLTYLNEAALLANLMCRYARDNIYTQTGCMLIAMNPFQKLDIYGEDYIQKYMQNDPSQLRPHAFAVAQKAYSMMLKEGKSQSILVSGESGSGKTETVKIIMRFLASASGSGSDVSRVSDSVLRTNPVLEAFGNAKTSRNNNSSRFGKFIDIQFGVRGTVIGANIVTYLLEKSRVVFQAKGERNYHIFYQLIRGGRKWVSKWADIYDDPQAYTYLKSGVYEIVNVDDSEEFTCTQTAMEAVGLQASEQESVFRAVAAILYLGQIKFSQDPKKEDHFLPTADKAADVESACKLIGCDSEALRRVLCERRVVTKTESFSTPHSQEQCLNARDGLAKALYSKLFDWLVVRINQCIHATTKVAHFIGVLDIFGFESFEVNSFEQLCINYANEKLQQQFIRSVLKSEQEEYEREGVKWTFVDFKDNQECLDFLEKKGGLLSILDEQCVFPKATDETFADRVKNDLKTNRYLVVPKPSAGKTIAKASFGIKHYAREVVYDCNGFLEKNKDAMHPDAVSFLTNLKFEFAAKLFAAMVPAAPQPDATGPQKANAKNPTVGFQFKDSLNSLMSKIGPTALHYITCVKSNTQLKPAIVEGAFVCGQLRCAGVLEAIQVARSGYPFRLNHREVLDRFSVVVAKGKHKKNAAMDEATERSESIKVLTELCKDSEGYQIGVTKIYFCHGQLEKLEEVRAQRLFKFAVCIQTPFRTRRALRHYGLLRETVLYMQAVARRKAVELEFAQVRKEFLKRAIITAPPNAKASVPRLNMDPNTTPLPPSTFKGDGEGSGPLTREQTQTAKRAMTFNDVSPLDRSKIPVPDYNFDFNAEDFDESRALELHIKDLVYLLTQPFDKRSQLQGFFAFYRLYERKVAAYVTHPCFADQTLVSLLICALDEDPVALENEHKLKPADWYTGVIALLKLMCGGADNASMLFESKGVPKVIIKMRRHQDSIRLLTVSCGCLAAVGRHQKLKKAIKYADGTRIVLDLILAVMEAHPTDKEVNKAASGCVAEYVSDAGSALGKRCVQSVVKACEMYPKESILLANTCSTILDFLLLDGLFGSHKKFAVASGCTETIIRAMEAFPDDVRVQGKAIAALGPLAEIAEGRKTIKNLSGDKLVLQTLAEFTNLPPLQEAGRMLLGRLDPNKAKADTTKTSEPKLRTPPKINLSSPQRFSKSLGM